MIEAPCARSSSVSQSYFHLAGQPLGVGSVILPGNYIRLVALCGSGPIGWDREAALESWRAANTPYLPSRGASVFVFETEASARHFRSIEPGFRLHMLYRVAPVAADAPIHRARIADFRPSSPMDHGWPGRYWLADQASAAEGAIPINEPVTVSSEAREILVGGPIRVQACLDG